MNAHLSLRCISLEVYEFNLPEGQKLPEGPFSLTSFSETVAKWLLLPYPVHLGIS